MAVITLPPGLTGTLYVVCISNATGQYLNPTLSPVATEAYQSGHDAQYAIVATPIGRGDQAFVTLPTGSPDVGYKFQLYKQAGSSPAATDSREGWGYIDPSGVNVTEWGGSITPVQQFTAGCAQPLTSTVNQIRDAVLTESTTATPATGSLLQTVNNLPTETGGGGLTIPQAAQLNAINTAITTNGVFLSANGLRGVSTVRIPRGSTPDYQDMHVMVWDDRYGVAVNDTQFITRYTDATMSTIANQQTYGLVNGKEQRGPLT